MSVGHRDSTGSILILGGHKADLLRNLNGLYGVKEGGTRTDYLPLSGAVAHYNEANGTNLTITQVEKILDWVNTQLNNSLGVVNVESATKPGKFYKVILEPNGSITCTCPGFTYRGKCWHVDAYKELTKED